MENENNLNNEAKASPSLCTVTVISKPARKLLVMYAKKAHDYFSFCEEVGCEWEGLFNSIPSRDVYKRQPYSGAAAPAALPDKAPTLRRAQAAA